MHQKLTFFYSPDCNVCDELRPHVEAFATANNATLEPIDTASLTDEPVLVPALMYTHPTTRGLLLVGSFCLEMLKWHLEHGTS